MNSEMMLYIKSAFAQNESTSASRRMSTSIRMRMEDGTYVATNAPYGYKLVDNNLEIVPEEAEVIKKIFALYLQGYGTNVIAKIIRESDGEKRAWNKEGIRYILINEKYIGIPCGRSIIRLLFCRYEIARIAENFRSIIVKERRKRLYHEKILMPFKN